MKLPKQYRVFLCRYTVWYPCWLQARAGLFEDGSPIWYILTNNLTHSHTSSLSAGSTTYIILLCSVYFFKYIIYLLYIASNFTINTGYCCWALHKIFIRHSVEIRTTASKRKALFEKSLTGWKDKLRKMKMELWSAPEWHHLPENDSRHNGPIWCKGRCPYCMMIKLVYCRCSTNAVEIPKLQSAQTAFRDWALKQTIICNDVMSQ